jgi:hypothetical protein
MVPCLGQERLRAYLGATIAARSNRLKKMDPNQILFPLHHFKMEETDAPQVDAPPQGLGLASIQQNLLREREKLIHELGLDGGLQDQQKLSASSKAASKRGKVKKSTEPAPGPVMARRSLRCV